MVKFQARITELGPLAGEFIENGIIVFFEEGAPEELREFSVLHAGSVLSAPVGVGDKLFIQDQAFEVLAVGDVANDNLGSLGHLIVKFNGNHEPEMPGDVCVEEAEIPSLSPGDVIRIEGRNPT